MSLTLAKAETLSLKSHPEFSEKWIQQQIIADSSILGIGEVELVAAEKIQPKAGRLDLLLHDEQLNRRYEVELMLGATDPSHIVRCIEYWDIERRRYPAYDHVAVLIAENITSRFLNVMSLLAGSIPLIAIQVNALRVDDKIVLHFTRVMDQTELRTDDEYEGGSSGVGNASVDRGFWLNRSSPKIMELADKILKVFDDVSESQLLFKYVKNYMAVATEGSFFNVAKVFPRKSHLYMVLPVSDVKAWLTRLEDEGLDAEPRKTTLVRMHLKPADFDAHQALLKEIITEAVKVSQAS